MRASSQEIDVTINYTSHCCKRTRSNKSRFFLPLFPDRGVCCSLRGVGQSLWTKCIRTRADGHGVLTDNECKNECWVTQFSSPLPQRTNSEEVVTEPSLVSFKGLQVSRSIPTPATTTHSQQSTSLRESLKRLASLILAATMAVIPVRNVPTSPQAPLTSWR
jgi:hypothetical protein